MPPELWKDYDVIPPLISTFATFAHQMMTAEWFGNIDPRLRFTADNLSDYSRYFNEYDYTEWNEEMFLEKKELYGMTKWSPKLYQNFSSLCARMMQAIWGYSFFCWFLPERRKILY